MQRVDVLYPDVKAALSVAARLKLKLRLGVFAHPKQHDHSLYQLDRQLCYSRILSASHVKSPVASPKILGLLANTSQAPTCFVPDI